MVALSPLSRGGGVLVNEVDLAADDRLDAMACTRVVELDRPVHHAVVGEPEGRLVELCGESGELLDLAGAIQQRVLGVDVQVGERLRGQHRGW